MEKKKTIVFGGAFNPPTLAHEAILKACVETSDKIDADIWVVPSGDRHDKQILAERECRISYIKAMIADVALDNVRINIIVDELDRAQVVETIDTVNDFNNAYPDREFNWVFGADSISTMADWRGGDWMLENLDMFVVSRRGCKVNKLAKHAVNLEVSAHDVSSTDVRLRLERGESVHGLVGPAVENLINKNTSPKRRGI